jgi:hypothetical protein
MDWAIFATSTTVPDISSIETRRLDFATVNVSVGDGTADTNFALPSVNSKHTVYQVTFTGTTDTEIFLEVPASEVGDTIELWSPPPSVKMAVTNANIYGAGGADAGSVLTLQKVVGVLADGTETWVSRHAPKPTTL